MCGILCIFSSQYTIKTSLLHCKNNSVNDVSHQYALFIIIRFVIHYNGVNLLSNTTIWWRDLYIILFIT